MRYVEAGSPKLLENLEHLAVSGILTEIESKRFQQVHAEAGHEKLSWRFDESFDSGMSSSECSAQSSRGVASTHPARNLIGTIGSSYQTECRMGEALMASSSSRGSDLQLFTSP